MVAQPPDGSATGYTGDVRRRPWLIPLTTFVAAITLFVAGIVVWRMLSTPLAPKCPTVVLGPCLTSVPPHRLHPLRAEVLWAASAVFALIAAGTGGRARRGPSRAQPTTA
jgi:hypothetical protein